MIMSVGGQNTQHVYSERIVAVLLLAVDDGEEDYQAGKEEHAGLISCYGSTATDSFPLLATLYIYTCEKQNAPESAASEKLDV